MRAGLSVVLDFAFFGGSFDPPHAGHDSMVRLALDHAKHVWIVPAVLSPFKQSTTAPFEERLAMAGLMDSVRDHPDRTSVLDLESRRPAPSYTKDTLGILRSENPGASIALVLGADAAADFAGWKEPGEILARHPVLLFGRSNLPGETVLQSMHARLIVDRRPVPPCSSTEIRRCLLLDEKGGMLRTCLSSTIWEHIRSRGLYRNAQD